MHRSSRLFASLTVLLLSASFLRVSAQQQYTYQGHTITKQQYDALMLFNEGYAFIQKKDYQNAEKKLVEALQLDPTMVSAHTNYGYVLGRLGRNDESMAELQKATQMDPTSFESWSTLGAMYQANGKLTESIDAYKNALRISPNNQLAPMIKNVIVQLTEARDRQAAVQKTIDPNQAQNDYFAFATAEGNSKWQSSKFPLKVFIPTDASCARIQNFRPEFNGALRQAFDEWAAASRGAVKFQYVARPEDADIEISWADDPSQVKRPSEGGEARVIFDAVHGIRHSKVVLLTKMPDATDFIVPITTIKFAAMHEIGHSLGILGHSPDSHDIMFCSVPAAVADWHVTERDGNTLAHIYAEGGTTVTTTSGEPSTPAQFQAAAKQFEEALKQNPNNSNARQNLAACLNNMAILQAKEGKYAEAAPNFKRALDLVNAQPNSPLKADMMRNYGYVMERLNDK